VRAWGDRLHVNVDSYDKANAKSILFDVVTKLQANELLIADFGHLYYQPRTKHWGRHSRCVVAYTNNTDPISFYMRISKTRLRSKPGENPLLQGQLAPPKPRSANWRPPPQNTGPFLVAAVHGSDWPRKAAALHKLVHF
jgi:hypothetical protein